jgi:dihydrofolate reductase
MKIALVVAVSRNGVIGRDGGLPWHLPSDLKRFKAVTMGKPIIMGRKTWDSLPRKPLPGRVNIVITRQSRFKAEGATTVATAAAALDAAAASGATECCVIGGGEIYRVFLPMADRVYLTVVDVTVAGDTVFPDLNDTEWSTTSTEHVAAGAQDTAGFEVRIMDRRDRAPR